MYYFPPVHIKKPHIFNINEEKFHKPFMAFTQKTEFKDTTPINSIQGTKSKVTNVYNEERTSVAIEIVT